MARASSADQRTPSLTSMRASPSSIVWLRASAATIQPFRKEIATMSCWPCTVRMPVFFCCAVSCRISGSWKRSNVPSTDMPAGFPNGSELVPQLPPDPRAQVGEQPDGGDDPRCQIAGIIPPRDAVSEPGEERDGEQRRRHQEGEEDPPPLPCLGRGDPRQQHPRPTGESAGAEAELERRLGVAEGAAPEMEGDGQEDER